MERAQQTRKNLAVLDGKAVYKVPVKGKMTISNVVSTCKNAGMSAACKGFSSQ